jgi:exosortase
MSTLRRMGPARREGTRAVIGDSSAERETVRAPAAETSRGVGRRFSRPSRADLAFSATVGTLFALSPLTGSARLLPSLVLGTLAGVAMLVARMRRPRAADVARAESALAMPSLPVWSVLVLAAAAFTPTVQWLYQQSTRDIWRNGHGVFVPFFVILLARHVLKRDTDPREESSAWSFALLVPGLALAVLDVGVRSHYLGTFGLLLALPGLSLLLLGARRTRAIAFPLALTLFLIPFTPPFENLVGLTIATADTVGPIIEILGLPVDRHESLLRLPNGVMEIGQNCSGLSALHASFAFAALLAGTARSRWRGLLLLALAYPIVVLFNALRTVGLVWMVLRFGGEVLHLPVHGLSGIATFAGSLLSLWLLADRRAFREAIS